MTTAQVVETSVTVNNKSPIQDYVHPDDQTQPSYFFVCKIFHNQIQLYFFGYTKQALKSKACAFPKR